MFETLRAEGAQCALLPLHLERLQQAADALNLRLPPDADKPVAEVLIGDTICPVAGRLSMDLMIIDATDAPAQALHRNQLVTLIGGPLDIDRVGKTAGTIGYLILTSLSRRYQRRYLGGA